MDNGTFIPLNKEHFGSGGYNVVNSLNEAFPGSAPDNDIALEEARESFKGIDIDVAVVKVGSEVVAQTQQIVPSFSGGGDNRHVKYGFEGGNTGVYIPGDGTVTFFDGLTGRPFSNNN